MISQQRLALLIRLTDSWLLGAITYWAGKEIMTQSCSESLYLIRFLVLRFIIVVGNKSGSESQPPLG